MWPVATSIIFNNFELAKVLWIQSMSTPEYSICRMCFGQYYGEFQQLTALNINGDIRTEDVDKLMCCSWLLLLLLLAHVRTTQQSQIDNCIYAAPDLPTLNISLIITNASASLQD